MTGVQPLFEEGSSSTDRERLQTQLAAVELLVAKKDRDVAHHDILLATVIEVLENGALTESELESRVMEAWPGCRTLRAQLRAALAAAQELDQVRPVQDGGLTKWELRPSARDELVASVDRGRGIAERFQSQVVDHFRDQGTPWPAEDVEPLVTLVIQALRHAVSQAFRSLTNGTVQQVGGWLRVQRPDQEDVTGFVEAKVGSGDRADLVVAICTVAFDSTSLFGRELVHHLVVGHLLYTFMMRPDQALAGATAGSLSGELLIIDTPTLLDLTAPPGERQPLLQLITAAVQAGMSVRLSSRSVEEFKHHLDTIEYHEAADLSPALAKGADPLLLAQLQRGSTAVHNWLRWAADQTSSNRTWSSWRQAVSSGSGPISILAAIGVKPESEAPYRTVGESAQYTEIRKALGEETSREGVRTRKDKVIDHDAHMLVDLWRARVANPPSDAKVWPGGFVLSPDLLIERAYERVLGEQVFPVALTLSQFAQIIGAYSSPRVSEELAFEIADSVAQQLLLSRASSIPSQMAQELAMAVAADPISPVEVEQLQLDLKRHLSAGREALSVGSADNLDLVGTLTTQIRDRRQLARREAQAAADTERDRTLVAQARSDERLATSTKVTRQLEAALDQSRKAGQAKDDALADAGESHRSDLQVLRRKNRVNVVSCIGLAVAAALLSTGHAAAAVIAGLSAVVSWAFGQEWAKGRGSVTYLVVNAVAVVLTVLPFVIDWASDEQPEKSPTEKPKPKTETPSPSPAPPSSGR